jgi:deoxyribodipyrimidine photolyase-related protein
MNLIIFPNQLYDIKFSKDLHIYLVEEPRFFTDFKFHKLKLAYHRASMKKYYDKLKKKYKIKYINFNQVTNAFYKELKEITIYDPYDIILLEKLNKLVKVNILDNIQFLLTNQQVVEMQKEIFPKKKYRHDIFYKYMRIKNDILIYNNKPVGGKWSFDTENRIKLPKDAKVPDLPKIKKNNYILEAIKYVNIHFSDNYGELDNFMYPIDHKGALTWLHDFLQKRLSKFGKYEDAVSTDHDFIFHSILSPMMNIGLLLDRDVVEISYKYYLENKTNVTLPSFEGFIRQIIGWRQYVYSLYILEGTKMRASNILGHRNKLNDKWWSDVNITPINFLINKIKKYAYVHHIERLMFLSNWMLLNQIDPDEVYRIFMEWTIDAYDWVMVPNVYGMGQSASDIMMTRIYFSSSNYILKMSNFKNDQTNWTKIWDAVYYNFIDKHKSLLASNYATAMQVKHYNNKTVSEKEEIKKIATTYMKELIK